MQARAPSAPTTPAVFATSREELMRHLPPAARAAFLEFQSGGDPAVLNPVILAIVGDYSPRPGEVPLAELPGDTRLIDDLGFDSLAITEVVFFIEDLFGVNITNEEIFQVRTLDDLRGFIRVKLAGRRAR